ncbi:hypothetical protein D3C71_1438350 [compost metagenome]
MGGDAVEHGCLSGADPLASAPDQSVARFVFEYLPCRFRDFAVCPGEGRAESIEDVALGLFHQCGRQVLEPRIHAKFRQSLHALCHST